MTVPTAFQPDTVARLMATFRKGDHEAAGRLVELFYPELRRIAAARMRAAEGLDHTLQPTAVVHQLYLELVKPRPFARPVRAEQMRRPPSWRLAAYLMKRLLIHHARPLSRRAEKVELPQLPGPLSPTEPSLVEIDDVLNRLAAINPALRRVMELRFSKA